MTTTISPYSGSPDSVKIENSPYQATAAIQAASAPPAPAAPSAPTKPKNKPRKRVNTAEKRHQHNAVERQRRETLNGKFIHLARLLPALANHRRPSKAAIVNGSISHLTAQRDQRLLAARLLRSLCAERDALAKECNEWRIANRIQLKEGATTSGWTDEMEEVCNVEKETFGTFAGMQEEDGEDEEQDAQDGGSSSSDTQAYASLAPPQDLGASRKGYEMGIEQATAAVASFATTGLITPRSSTELDPMSLALGLSTSSGDILPPSMPQPIQSQSLPINWSNGFSFPTPMPSMTMSTPTDSISGSNASLPFSTFLADSLEGLSSSPPGSMHGIPTPPTTADFSRFTHTPSPTSSGSFEDSSSFLQMPCQPQQPFQPMSQLHQAQQLYLDQLQLQQQSTDRAQLTPQQQLILMHTFQQQQLQQQHLAEMQKQSAGAYPLPSPLNLTGMNTTGYPLQGLQRPLPSPVLGSGGQGMPMPMPGRISAEQMEALRKYSAAGGALAGLYNPVGQKVY